MKINPVKSVLLLIEISIMSGLFAQCTGAKSEDISSVIITLDLNEQHQVIHNFGASDAWSMQFIGKYWSEEKKEKVAELLFSTAADSSGHPLGIGLSAWRFNIGGGSDEQGSESSIRDEWRRAESFLKADGSYDWGSQSGQVWFLKKAQEYEVSDLIGFVNSPPVFLSKNGKAWSDNGLSANLAGENYAAYAEYLAEVIKGLEVEHGIVLHQLSPFNEPQWEWECCKQEGSPWNNDELAAATRIINRTFVEQGISETKLEICDAGQIDYLISKTQKQKNRSNQIYEFFDPNSTNYLGDLETLSPRVTGHSYFSTWDSERLVKTRTDLKRRISETNDRLEYWMTEYCLLEDNEEISGVGRDLGIDPAIYMSKVIHADLVHANASAWHWWLAVSPYNYKDGLLYVDMDKTSENLYESKMLWALGNYARFVRPEAKRITTSATNVKADVFASAYLNANDELVLVMTNQSVEDKKVSLKGISDYKTIQSFITSDVAEDNLKPMINSNFLTDITLPPRSILTCVFQR